MPLPNTDFVFLLCVILLPPFESISARDWQDGTLFDIMQEYHKKYVINKKPDAFFAPPLLGMEKVRRYKNHFGDSVHCILHRKSLSPPHWRREMNSSKLRKFRYTMFFILFQNLLKMPLIFHPNELIHKTADISFQILSVKSPRVHDRAHLLNSHLTSH